MKHLSPPSPQVRAIVRMSGIAGIIITAYIVMSNLRNFFRVEDIMTGICACIIAVAVYMIYQVMVEQERHKDALNKLGQE
jgi:amino acid permease